MLILGVRCADEIDMTDHITKQTPIIVPQVREEPNRGTRVIIMTATYYTWTGNQTKTETWPQEGRTIAVDPKVIPLGSRLIIDGIGGYIAEDTGGLIKSNKIDIYKSNKANIPNVGVKTVTVQIVR